MHSSEKPHWSHSVAAHPECRVRVDTVHVSRRSTKPVLGDKELYKEFHFSENKQFCKGNGEKKLHLFSRN